MLQTCLLVLTLALSVCNGSYLKFSNLHEIVENELNKGMTNSTSYESCGSSCNTNSSTNKHCFCDLNCEKYFDCCYDYWMNCKVNSSVSEYEMSTSNLTRPCHSSNEPIDNCQYDLLQPGLCSKNNDSSASSGDFRLRKLPAYDTTTRILYKNFYCAKCNGVDNKSIEILMPKILCSNTFEETKLVMKCKQKYDDQRLKLHYCSTEKLYDCESNKIDFIDKNQHTFLIEWNQEFSDFYSRLCRTYVMPFSVLANNQTNILFRNVHCFKCWLVKRSTVQVSQTTSSILTTTISQINITRFQLKAVLYSSSSSSLSSDVESVKASKVFLILYLLNIVLNDF